MGTVLTKPTNPTGDINLSWLTCKNPPGKVPSRKLYAPPCASYTVRFVAGLAPVALNPRAVTTRPGKSNVALTTYEAEPGPCDVVPSPI
jgi:hypothetical protein